MPKRHRARVSRAITYSGQKTTHNTDGLNGYPAVDIFAPAGTEFLAPEDGKIVRLSGKGGDSGQVFGYSIYFVGKSGRTYFITHLNQQRAPKGRYAAGTPIGTVSQWTTNPGATHAHVGVARLWLPADYGGYTAPLSGNPPRPPQEQTTNVPGPSAQPELPQPPDTTLLPGGPPQPEPAQVVYPGENPPGDFQELTTQNTWQTLADMPFSSPQTQEWANRIRRISG